MIRRMSEDRRRHAQQRLEQARLVRSMIDMLRALLDGHMTRAQAQAWALARAPASFDSATAAAVFEALVGLDDNAIVGDVELRAYVAALASGQRFVGDPDPLVCIRMEIDALAEQVGATPIHWWSAGLGWTRELSFAALASGRPFVAVARAEQPDRTYVHKRVGDLWQDALVELFEQLAIDDREAIAFAPEIELAELPVWVLWREDDNGNRVEIDRYRSYAKAELDERLHTDRGHRQSYWIRPG
jgi:hypothetical protein